MVRIFDTGNVAPTGVDGSAVGSATVGPVDGDIVGVYVKYDSSQAASIDTAIATAHEPVVPILSLTNVKTSGWYYPRVALCDQSGTAVDWGTNLPAVERMSVRDAITVSWAQADVTHPVRAYILVEQG